MSTKTLQKSGGRHLRCKPNIGCRKKAGLMQEREMMGKDKKNMGKWEEDNEQIKERWGKELKAR